MLRALRHPAPWRAGASELLGWSRGLQAHARCAAASKPRESRRVVGLTARPIRSHRFDRIALSHRVQTFLGQGKEEEAYVLVVDGQRYGDSVPAWNTLLQHYASLGRFKRAFRLFNDMKKRGVRPNGYTYSIVLQATRKQAHNAGSEKLPPAYRDFILQVLRGDASTEFTPELIHLNNALAALATWNASDAVLALFSEFQRTFTYDNYTYSTTLRALRPIGAPDAGPPDRRDVLAVVDHMVYMWNAGSLTPDSYLLREALVTLAACGKQGVRDMASLADEMFGFDISARHREYVSTEVPRLGGHVARVEMDSVVLDGILRAGIDAKDYKYCELVLDATRKRAPRDVEDRAVIGQIFRIHADQQDYEQALKLLKEQRRGGAALPRTWYFRSFLACRTKRGSPRPSQACLEMYKLACEDQGLEWNFSLLLAYLYSLQHFVLKTTGKEHVDALLKSTDIIRKLSHTATDRQYVDRIAAQLRKLKFYVPPTRATGLDKLCQIVESGSRK